MHLVRYPSVVCLSGVGGQNHVSFVWKMCNIQENHAYLLVCAHMFVHVFAWVNYF